jgi:hypothetical protein
MNLRVQISESKGATSQVSFYRYPGFREFVRATTAGWSSCFEMNGRAFGVSGDTFYEITYPANVGTVTARGTVLVGTDPSSIWSNGKDGDQLLVVSGSSISSDIAGNAYVYDLTANTLTAISTLTGKATQGGYLNGYGIVFDQTTGTNYYSDLLDFSVFDPANFWARSNQPDAYQAMCVTSWGYIWLPGGQTGEAWYPNGGFPLPFQPDPAGNFNAGTAATFSLTNAGGSMCWLATGHDGGLTVMAASGLQPQVISDFALDQELAGYARIDDCIGESFQYKGQTFLRLTFPTEQVTKQYDFSSQLWTDGGTWISEEDDFTYLRPVYHMYAFNKHLMGDRESGVLYEMSDDFSTDVESRPLRWVRRTPAVVDEQNFVFHQKLSILMRTGVGTGGLASGYDPKVNLRYSDDGGMTWGHEISADVGEIGAYPTLVWFWQLGMARNRVYELSGTDPVITSFTNVFLEAEKAA